MDNIWNNSREQRGKTLNENIEREIVVVGGGIAGYLTAFRLAERGAEVTLLEADTLFRGVTEKTTAHIEALQGYIYSKLDNIGDGVASLYFESQLKAIDEYEELVEKYHIDCGFKRLDSYLYTLKKLDKLKKEYHVLKECGADCELYTDTEILGFRAAGAIKLKNQSIFNPIEFLNGLPVSFEIYENTRVTDFYLDENKLSANGYIVTAKKVIIATNFPVINIPGFYFLKMYKSSSYAVATDNAPYIGGVYQSDLENGITYRNYKDMLITGGLDHRTGRHYKDEKYRRLTDKAKLVGDMGEKVTEWSANDCITFDNIPYAGYYTKKNNNLFVITGFNKWGMTNAMATSKVVASLVMGDQPDEFTKLFSPQRKKSGFFACLKNLCCTVKNLVIKPLCLPLKCASSINKGEGKIVWYNGKVKAVYRDKDGELHVCKPLCAHLGCRLSFNGEDKTWDCPCHGSRFDVNGNIIVGPTVKSIRSDK